MTAGFFSETSRSLVKKHLGQPLFEQLRHLKTGSGFTLEKAIRSGIKNPDSAIGIYAGDAESYKVFSPVFDPVIFEYHNFPKGRDHVPDFTKPYLPLIDPEKKYILSTRIRVARNLEDFCFPAHMSLSHRKELEKKTVKALDSMKGNFKGEYVSLTDMAKNEFKQLENKPLVFEKGDRFQDAAGINSDFPEGRGVFYSADRQFIVWINEEDHLRIMSLEKGSDIASVFNRLCQGLQILEEALDFARDKTYGYLTSCPTNLGTAMRAGVHIRLEKLNRKMDILNRLAREYDLQIRGTQGEKTKVEDAVFDISNAKRLGISETAIIQTLHKGLLAIINAEKTV